LSALARPQGVTQSRIRSVGETLLFLAEKFGLKRVLASAWVSAATDFKVF
jgi:hypothetical protein